MTQNRNKIATSFRLSPEAMGMLDRLKERTGLSQAGILELAIRRMAEAEGVREGAGVTKVTEEAKNGSDPLVGAEWACGKKDEKLVFTA